MRRTLMAATAVLALTGAAWAQTPPNAPAKDAAASGPGAQAAPGKASPAKDAEVAPVNAGGGPTAGNDITGVYKQAVEGYDYVKRVEMIPMRDGTKLYTVIVSPKGVRDAPIILTRTPYNAKKRAERADSPTMLGVLPLADEDYVTHGYIRVYQDVRGKYGSEGEYVMTRPPIGPLNPTKVDHVTDAYDTIDWLVKNTPGNNGRVGMIGSSYEGFTVVMALLAPHPALKAAVPESPMIDGWMGDDWFHFGAFRQPNFDYTKSQTAQAGAGEGVQRSGLDDYEAFLAAGSAGDYARARGLDRLPWAKRMMEHPAYDAFWQGQALDKLMVAAKANAVPTMWEQGLWDQEDMWGANKTYAALKAAGRESNNWLVMGPWFHSQVNRDGWSLGPFKWSGDTALQFRREMVLPFFEEHLRGRGKADLARATVYNAATNRWERFDTWPIACESGCRTSLTPIYLQAQGGLGIGKPGADAGDSYVSDPAKPVTYLPRPVKFSDSDAWRTWLVRDQRFVDGRPDVLTYSTPALTEAVTLRGGPVADLIAATTGTDGDFVVKLIDVYPAENPNQPELGGYQFPIATDIFRGRYRQSFSQPSAIPANTDQHYRFVLPQVNHVFLPGHRIMVQVQSTLFPLYDRNPQTYVSNIFNARPADYRKATVTVKRGSAVWLPVVR